MKVTRDGTEIRTVEDWLAAMPARVREKHWKDGRSAKELARAWVGTGAVVVPEEVARLLETDSEFSAVELAEATPEAEVRLDDFAGNTRQADLLIVGRRAGEPVVISVEAKADESFGPTIGEALLAGEQVEGSNAPARIRQLCEAVFGVGPDEITGLRYQLLHSVAGTLIAASERRARRALFLIHEFLGSTRQENVERNAADFEAFVRRLGWKGEVGAGWIAGPLEVPGGGRVPSDVELFIGKAVRGQ